MLIQKSTPVLLQIYYWMPKHPLLLQEFIWGYEDKVPELTKTHKFLRYWKNNVNAVISEIFLQVSTGKQQKFIKVDDILDI